MFSGIYNTDISVNYNHPEGFSRYHSDIAAEYNQCIEEGILDQVL